MPMKAQTQGLINYVEENKNFNPKPIKIPEDTYKLKYGSQVIKKREDEIISLQNSILVKRDEGFKLRNKQRKNFFRLALRG